MSEANYKSHQRELMLLEYLRTQHRKHLATLRPPDSTEKILSDTLRTQDLEVERLKLQLRKLLKEQFQSINDVRREQGEKSIEWSKLVECLDKTPDRTKQYSQEQYRKLTTEFPLTENQNYGWFEKS
ncbi:hypothetical protein M8J77_007927 [Diaphorina citri]|nr:hypothetical protein M8J77_007927 [Diaphorina citri]